MAPAVTRWAGLALGLVLAGCGTPNRSSPGDGGPSDAPSAEGGPSDAASPLRTATTRGLLPTPVENVLLDPFVTSDISAYHFRAIAPPSSADASIAVCQELVRSFSSFSPVGVTAPVLVTPSGTECPEILAPFPGGSSATDTFGAQIWVSVFDEAGQTPLPLPDAQALTSMVTVALLPNTLPTDPPADAFPLTLTDAGATTLGDGSQWGLLSVSAASLPKGGWFFIQIATTTATIKLAAPQVVPTNIVALRGPPRRPMTQLDRAAIEQYGWLVKNRPRSRPRAR